MKVLFDTNVLLRAAQPAHPMCVSAVSAGLAIRNRGDEPCVVPQVLYEFWVVCTRPLSENGLQFNVAQVSAEVERFRPPFFLLLHDKAAVLREWHRLVVKHEVKGKAAHDARLAAAMHVHGVEGILTFNADDFARYPGITVLNPREVAGTSA